MAGNQVDPYRSVGMLTRKKNKVIGVKLSPDLDKALAAKMEEEGMDQRQRPWLVRTLLFLWLNGKIDLRKMAREAGL